MNNVVDLVLLRKIKGLERSLNDYTNILKIRIDFINKLQSYQNYLTINRELIGIQKDILELEKNIGQLKDKLVLLRKEAE